MSPRSRFSASFAIPLSASILLGGALAGCGPSQTSSVTTEVRDSAGITIVESSGLPPAEAGGWALGQTPTLSIGTLDGDTLYQLYQVSNGLRLEDGTLIISENGDHQLRFYAPDGTFLKSLGREGQGPGEFQYIELVGALGSDTLVALDGAQRRISLFHRVDGFLQQTLIGDEAGSAYFPNGMFADGSIVFGGGLSFGPGGGLPSDGLHRETASFVSVDRNGEISTDFGEIPGVEVFMKTRGGGGEMMMSASVIHFGKRPLAVARGDRLILGSGDSFEAKIFLPDGTLDRILRVQTPPVPVTPEELEELLSERISALDDPAAEPATRSSFNEIPHADFMPAYQGFFIDSEGFYWIEGFRRPGEAIRKWYIFDREGKPRTQLSLPRENRLLDVGPDFVLTVFQDQLGVEYLRLFPLTRGS